MRMLLVVDACHQYVIQIHKSELQTPADRVHQPLERLRRMLKSKRHLEKGYTAVFGISSSVTGIWL